VPTPPSQLTATAKPEAVTLMWESPSTTKLFNVYRIGANEPPNELAPPINAAPVQAPPYSDVPPYGTYTYRVSAVASTGPPRIESDVSAPVTVTYKDLTPPPAPATLTALVEVKNVRLIWDPVNAPDLAGYFVYRYERNQRIKFQTGAPIPDVSAPVTVTYKDLTPPAAPATLTALVEVKNVRLIWDPVNAPDLAGYFVYRYERNQRIKFQTGAPIPATHFGDSSPDPGITYTYAVTAVDKNGNESEERKSEPVLVPKTP
jgi:fibronectin type 3 domain-containing protein